MYIIILFFIILTYSLYYIKKRKHLEKFEMNISMPIYVIHLEDNKPRWDLLIKQNIEHLNIIKFPAIDGKTLQKEQIKNIIDNDSYLYNNFEKNRGEIGCAMSHVTLWNKIKDEIFIIIEDDIIFSNDFYPKLNVYLKNAPKDWDIIYLGGSNIKGYKVNDFFIKPYTKGRENLGTYAMLINKTGRNKLLEICLPIKKSIDHHLKKYFNNYLKVYYVNPPLIKHNNEIDSDRRIINNQKKRPNKKWIKNKQTYVKIIN